ncbi:MAG: flagellar basal body-associated FliL family protein [Actinomycetota bacterium]
MADDDNEEEEGGGGKKKIIMGVVGVAALGGVYNFVLKSPPPEEEQSPEELAAAMEPVEGEIHQMEELVLNIEGENGPAYLRVGVAVVLDEMTMAADFAMEEAIAYDIAVQYLSAQTVETLGSADGRDAAKEELTQLMQEAYVSEEGTPQVVRVLFTSLVMQ